MLAPENELRGKRLPTTAVRGWMMIASNGVFQKFKEERSETPLCHCSLLLVFFLA